MRKLFLLLGSIVFFAVQALAQRTVTGKVTDEKGAPLPNVSVMVRGTTTGTVTKQDGSFTLIIPANAKALVFSSVDMSPVEKAIGALSEINATLKAEDKTMSEVVVTAFGIKKDKKTLGYSVTQLTSEQLTGGHTINVTNAMAGKIPGVRISGTGGSFTGSSILIRGFTTIQGSNQPLFVVDGIPISNAGGGVALQTGVPTSPRTIDLNQDDIESMSVLKGPSAAALYGSRAANGVILITTKKGKAGQKSSITFSSNYQIETVNRFPDYQNQYAEGNGGVFSPVSQSSWGPLMTGQVVNQYNPATNLNDRAAPLMAFPNNVRDIFQHGSTWQSTIAFSGGTDKSSFRFSYGYLNSQGTLVNNVLNKHNFSLNVMSKVNNYLTITASGNYSNNASRRTQQGNQLSNPLFRGWITPRSYDLTGLAFEDALGNQRYPLGEDNPYWTIKNNRYRDEINRFVGNLGFNFRLTKWLTYDHKLGTDVYSTFVHGYDQIGARGQANTNAAGVGAVVETRGNVRLFNSTGFFTATKKFNAFSGVMIVGTEFQQNYSNTATENGKSIIVRDFEQLSNTSSFTPSPSFGSTKTRLLGLFADLTVSYKNIASLNATARNDWSSTFKENNNSYFYWTVGGSLNVTELLPSIKSNVIDNIKLRGNYTKVGKAGDFAYATDSYYGGAGGTVDGFGPTISFPFNGVPGFGLGNTSGSVNLGPEFTVSKEIAAELSFFKGRLGLEYTHYWQNSTKIIFSVPVSATSGIGAVTKNAGNISNKGNEALVTVVPVKTRNVTWTITAAYTQFKSIVDKLETGVSEIILGGFVTPNTKLVAGQEYGVIFGQGYQRDPTKGNKIIVDANGFPLITTANIKLGNPNPKWSLGVTNTLAVKGFFLSFLIDYKKGGDIYSRNVADLQRNGVAAETAEFPRYDAGGVPTKNYIFDAVYANGTPNTTMLTAEQYWGNSGKHTGSEGFIYDATWFRIREASISYSLPASLLSKTPFGSAELSVFGHNLYLHCPNYPHLDPEQNVLGISNAQGLEFNALPSSRTIGVGIKFSF
ncbi:MAG TPA: SusC/RagA family TonB-linked outer membrane protein [Chitinophagaceae bacterium]|nr:SusC/RagA family TonB-linked outer membrane protein [Chitinophagaceae bacterium]